MREEITVVIPTSPIPIHPSTEIIERAIDSIQHHLPDSKILVLADGVRPEVEHRREQYREYCGALLNLLNFKYKNGKFCIFGKHLQQAGMLKAAMWLIETPLLMFFEHDATLDDKPINWIAIQNMLLSGVANTIRLYWHETIHPEHAHLFGERIGDFVKTTQWSSWPHISRKVFYERILQDHFAVDDCKMTETVLYSPVLESPWEDFKTWAYIPQPDGIRFHHLDARRDPKTGEKDPGNW